MLEESAMTNVSNTKMSELMILNDSLGFRTRALRRICEKQLIERKKHDRVSNFGIGMEQKKQPVVLLFNE